MISCEDYESRFPFENSPEIASHRQQCPFCSSFTLEMNNLHNLLAQAPKYQAPAGFELRLDKRLSELETEGSARQWSVAPRLLAYAAGVAMVLIAGAIYEETHVMQPGTLAVETAEKESLNLAAAERDSTAEDSLKIKESGTGPWNVETVSAGR